MKVNWLTWLAGVMVFPGLAYMAVVAFRLGFLAARGQLMPEHGRLRAIQDFGLLGMYLYAMYLMVRYFPWTWPIHGQ